MNRINLVFHVLHKIVKLVLKINVLFVKQDIVLMNLNVKNVLVHVNSV